MNSRLLVFCILATYFVSFPLRANSAKSNEDEIVKLPPYVVETKTLANAGFTLKAKFRLIGTGIKELVIVEVGPRSEAKKAGLSIGEKILQIRDVKVEGLGLEELQKEFEAEAVDGKVPLLIQAKGSNKTRTVVLQFTDHAQKVPTQASSEPKPTASTSTAKQP